jgi:hypothetical protein
MDNEIEKYLEEITKEDDRDYDFLNQKEIY